MEKYKTIKKEVSVTQIIEKSKFIAHAKPVESRDEAEAFIDEIKSSYRDATHNVPAMVIGDKMQIQWASDDGEPQGTSGAPMVRLMTEEGLTNLVIVVTRYFGGIKLGTGGLVRAYTSSAKQAIEEAGICCARELCRYTVETDYTFLSKFQQMASDTVSDNPESFVIEETGYLEKVTMKILTPEENCEQFEKMVANITAGSGIIKDREMTVKLI